MDLKTKIKNNGFNIYNENHAAFKGFKELKQLLTIFEEYAGQYDIIIKLDCYGRGAIIFK